MIVQLKGLLLDKGAFDAGEAVAGDGVDDLVRMGTLHEEAEGADVATQNFFGAEAGDVCACGVDGMGWDVVGEFDHFPCDVSQVHAHAEEAAAAVDPEGNGGRVERHE